MGCTRLSTVDAIEYIRSMVHFLAPTSSSKESEIVCRVLQRAPCSIEIRVDLGYAVHLYMPQILLEVLQEVLLEMGLMKEARDEKEIKEEAMEEV